MTDKTITLTPRQQILLAIVLNSADDLIKDQVADEELDPGYEDLLNDLQLEFQSPEPEIIAQHAI